MILVSRAATHIRRLAESSVDFFLPRGCLVCARAAQQFRSPVCPLCLFELEGRLILDDHRRVVKGVLSVSDSIDSVFSLYAYCEEGALQGIVHAMKYRGAQSLCRRMGRLVGEALRREAGLRRIDALVPVPIHPARLRERRYNQSVLIAQGISDAAGIPIARGALRRMRKTSPQTFLGPEERARNIRGAIALGRKLSGGMHVALVDDVVTTGATANACAQVLKENAPVTVTVITLAVAKADHLILHPEVSPVEFGRQIA